MRILSEIFKREKNNLDIRDIFVFVSIIVTLYCYGNLIYSLVVYKGNAWIAYLFAAVVITIYSILNLRRQNPNNRFIAFSTPFLLLIMFILTCLASGESRVFFETLCGISVVGMIFSNSAGFLMYVLLANVIVPITLLLTNGDIVYDSSGMDISMMFLTYDTVNIIIFVWITYMTKHFNNAAENANSFQAIVKTTPTFMLVIDDNADVRYISESLVSWLNISEGRYITKRPILDLFSSSEMQILIQDIMESGSYIDKSFEITIDGKTHWFMMNSTPLSTSAARVFQWNDITPVMEAKNVAETAAKAKSDFLANMSHEIRTPLNAIMGVCDLLQRTRLTEEQKNHANIIKQSSSSLLKIINDILDFSKIDAHKMEIINMPFELSSLLNDTASMINIKAIEAGIAFTTNIQKDVPSSIVADEIRLKQVLVNLLNNAVKFTKSGCVSLKCSCEYIEKNKIKLKFAIKDSGQGIKSQDIPKLFGAFQQVDTRKNRNKVGTGLGLAISHQLVALMGGNVSVESVYGQGSTFSFFIVCDVVKPDPIAGTNDFTNIKILCFEPNNYRKDSFIESFANFSITNYHFKNSINEFQKSLETDNFTHVIFDASAMEIVQVYLNKHTTDSKFILVREVTQQFVSDPRFSVYIRPFMENALVNALLGEKNVDNALASEQLLGNFHTKGANILVVDDTQVNLFVASELLATYGIAVETASSGLIALEKVANTAYDIVFMDHMMPEMDGIDATKAIRAMNGKRFQNAPIVALTANAIIGTKEIFFEAGMNDFISKPIEIRQLNRILRQFLPENKIIDKK